MQASQQVIFRENTELAAFGPPISLHFLAICRHLLVRYDMSSLIRFHFVRHVPVINPDGIWYGRDIEIDISSDRTAQMFNQLASVLPADPRTSLWLTSDYPRAQMTCEGVGRHVVHLPQVIVNSGFREQQYGIMEGRCHREVKNDPACRAYLDDMWNNAPQNGESMSMFQTRVADTLNQVIETVDPAITDIAVFSHGGVIMAAYAEAKGQRLIDVFCDRKDAQVPSFSYMSRLTLSYDREVAGWSQNIPYAKGLPKLGL